MSYYEQLLKAKGITLGVMERQARNADKQKAYRAYESRSKRKKVVKA